MKKRTVVSLLFYFFFITNSNAKQQKNSTSSVGDFIADMVRSFALSGENGQMSLGKGGKGKLALAKGNQQQVNAISAMLTKLLVDDSEIAPNDADLGTKCLEKMAYANQLPSIESLRPSCKESFQHLICDPLKGTHNITQALHAFMDSSLAYMFDSWGKIPARILLGNFEWLGAYEECSGREELKYCNSDMDLKNTLGLDQTLHYGSCWPQACNTEEVETLITVTPVEVVAMLPFIPDVPEWLVRMQPTLAPIVQKFSEAHKRTLCDNIVDYYTPGWQATLTLVMMFIFLCSIGTTIEAVQEWRMVDEGNDLVRQTEKSNEKPVEFSEFKTESGINNGGFMTQFSTTELTKSQSESKLDTTATIKINDADATFRSPVAYKHFNDVQGSSCNYLLDFFLCFSILRNTRAIFCTKVSEKTVTCINGIRVISFTWVILGNYLGWVAQKLKTDNLKAIAFDAVYDFSFMIVNNAYVSVDTFFLLSGFLTAYLYLKKYMNEGVKVRNVLQSYLHRFVRITPTLGLVFLMYFFLPQILRGPKSLFITQTDEMSSGVKNYWWAAILYINNFFPTMAKSGSISWTFYLSNDMQFFVLAPVIFFVVIRIHRSQSNKTMAVLYNFLFLFSICLASFFITAIITLKHSLPSVGTAAMLPIDGTPYNLVDHKTFEEVANMVYLKPYCRITPYIVGLFLGYLFVHDIKPAKGQMGTLITATGWISAIIGGLTVVYGPWRVFTKNGVFFTDAETGLYSACHRFVWGAAVAWVVYACHYKRAGIINNILSWSAWMPLSRLTFCAYLMHMEVIYTSTLLLERPIHFQITSVVFAVIPIICITYTGAYMLAVFVEYPIMNVEKYVRRVFFRR